MSQLCQKSVFDLLIRYFLLLITVRHVDKLQQRGYWLACQAIRFMLRSFILFFYLYIYLFIYSIYFLLLNKHKKNTAEIIPN